jgi:hypothetical protein
VNLIALSGNPIRPMTPNHPATPGLESRLPAEGTDIAKMQRTVVVTAVSFFVVVSAALIVIALMR